MPTFHEILQSAKFKTIHHTPTEMYNDLPDGDFPAASYVSLADRNAQLYAWLIANGYKVSAYIMADAGKDQSLAAYRLVSEWNDQATCRQVISVNGYPLGGILIFKDESLTRHVYNHMPSMA